MIAERDLPGHAPFVRGLSPTGPFIHLCRHPQLAAVHARHFGGEPVVVLLLDPARLDPSALRDEDLYGHGDFPHYYGDVPAEAVVGALRYPALSGLIASTAVTPSRREY